MLLFVFFLIEYFLKFLIEIFQNIARARKRNNSKIRKKKYGKGKNYRGSFCGVVDNVLGCDIVVSKSCYCIHFWTNTLAKNFKPVIPTC